MHSSPEMSAYEFRYPGKQQRRGSSKATRYQAIVGLCATFAAVTELPGIMGREIGILAHVSGYTQRNIGTYDLQMFAPALERGAPMTLDGRWMPFHEQFLAGTCNNRLD